MKTAFKKTMQNIQTALPIVAGILIAILTVTTLRIMQ
jgi:hypothetical protein